MEMLYSGGNARFYSLQYQWVGVKIMAARPWARVRPPASCRARLSRPHTGAAVWSGLIRGESGGTPASTWTRSIAAGTAMAFARILDAPDRAMRAPERHSHPPAQGASHGYRKFPRRPRRFRPGVQIRHRLRDKNFSPTLWALAATICRPQDVRNRVHYPASRGSYVETDIRRTCSRRDAIRRREFRWSVYGS